MEILGHSQIAITANRYTHAGAKVIDEAGEAFERAFGP
jgi:hypothetical protein